MDFRNIRIDQYLSENGVKPSFQRLKIFEYLIKYKNHPTVDMIYKELVQSIPTLSKTTVYNTLSLFVEKKVAIMLYMKDTEARYDADVSIHGHFKCENCEKIFDFEIDPSNLKFNNLEGFQFNEIQVSCEGICISCKNK